MSTMKAVAIERYGDARALEYTDVPCPELTDDNTGYNKFRKYFLWKCAKQAFRGEK
jgi:hypothetical protein